MTDRELLEAAARAAGVDAEFHPELGYGPEGMWLKGERSPDNSKYWNPLTDDGDALRLALMLGLSFEPYPLYSTEKHSVIVKQRRRSDQLRENNPTECIEKYNGDPMGATRRAIVRAAAAIGAKA